MANRIFNPDIQYLDGTGAPLSGAQLFAYASGTSTKQNTYSDKALTIANSNPIVLDASGRVGACFLQNLQYKFVLAPSTDTDPPTSPIWTQDPVYTSDYSTVAQVQGVNGNPNGQLAGTQASATIPASMAWDYTNDILYVCTSTGTSVTAVWTAVNQNSVGTVLPTPQGRLTLTSNTPVLNQDAVSQTTVYYTPYTGVICPIYNGTTFVPINFVSQLSLGLVAAHAANKIYDLYLFLLNGVATLGSGPTWDAGSGGSVVAGSCARGTGSGGAALAMLNGILTNAVSMTMTYGGAGATTTVGANQGTYVGSMFMDSTNGQVSCYVSAGQSRKYGIWNTYNRVPVIVQLNDSTASWTYSTASTWRQSRGQTGNTITSFTGLLEEYTNVHFAQTSLVSFSNTTSDVPLIGIGFNSTSAPSGQYSNINGIFSLGGAAITGTAGCHLVATYVNPPALGINALNSLENVSNANGATFYGGSGGMLMTATWRG